MVKTVSNSMEKVKTMGGVNILPDMTVNDMTDKDAALLILPGGETWLEPVHSEILDVADKFLVFR